MNSVANKHMLWESTKTIYKSGMSRPDVIALFEATILEVDAIEADLATKNQHFLRLYPQKVAALKQVTFKPEIEIIQGVTLEDIMAELVEIKRLIANLK
jgi:hypothetical protein